MTTNLMATVAGDLRAIVTLHEKLDAEAVNSANDPLMPGGKAMVSLAYVAKPSQYAWQVDYLERVLDQHPDLSADDDDWEPPLQTLCFWSDEWRVVHDMELDRRATVATEANFLRWCLDWAWDNEPHFEDFVRDVAKARRRIEDVLTEGQRTLQGVPCLYDECKGRRLQRKLKPKYDKDGERARDERGNGLWDFEDWTCPKCKRTWGEDEYARRVTAAHEATKIEDIEGTIWCSADYAARKVERSVKTVRTWINRDELATLCMIAGRRLPFVSLEDVRELSEAKSKRKKRVA